MGISGSTYTWENKFGDLEEAIDAKQNSTDNSLSTLSKSVVGAINEVFTSASNGKSLIANAITGKGVSTSPSATYQQLAGNIGLLGAYLPRTYLYNAGDECTALTGGWTGVTIKGNATETKNTDNLYVASNTGVSDGIFFTNNAIDLTNYTKLMLAYTSDDYNNGWACVAVGDSQTVNAYPDNNITGKTLEDYRGPVATAELDITAITGAHYIKIGTGSGSSSPLPYMRVYEIWLEA
jgi:hypothetical protein